MKEYKRPFSEPDAFRGSIIVHWWDKPAEKKSKSFAIPSDAYIFLKHQLGRWPLLPIAAYCRQQFNLIEKGWGQANRKPKLSELQKAVEGLLKSGTLTPGYVAVHLQLLDPILRQCVREQGYKKRLEAERYFPFLENYIKVHMPVDSLTQQIPH